VKPVPDLNKATALAATGQTKAAAALRVKLSPHGFCLDHPDPELGEQLMADALGVTDRDAMHGILRQLVKASVNGQKPDAVNLAFMISMVKSIKPRDSVEAMLVAQMVSVHVMAMRCAYHLAKHARCLLLFDDRTFVGDVRSSEMCPRSGSSFLPILLLRRRWQAAKAVSVDRVPWQS
jgi:hypothetical protein